MVKLVVLVAALGEIPAAQSDSVPFELREGRQLLQAGNVDAALGMAHRYVRMRGDDPRGYLLLGDVYSARRWGRQRAVQAYYEARRRDPGNPLPAYRIGVLGMELGGADGERLAAEGLGHAIAVSPLFRDAWPRWLILARDTESRRTMIHRLSAHRALPIVKVRIARLLIEEEHYAEAMQLLDSALTAIPSQVEALALRAQAALDAGDTDAGLTFYRRALANAGADSSDVLWNQIVGIATPEEVTAWERGVAPADKPAWFDAFWARRNPDLFAGSNRRIEEHFRRLRYARKHYPLKHPLGLYERSPAFRGAQLGPNDEEHGLYLACEAESEAGTMPILDRLRVLPLGFDIALLDSTAARLGYNQATGLDDRGILYLRFGPPDQLLIGADNVRDPQCGQILMDLERWRYAEVGEVRFANPAGFSKKGPALNRLVFRPMNERQFAATGRGITSDASDVPAPLQFGVWTAAFRSDTASHLTDLVVVSTNGALAARLVDLPGMPHSDPENGARSAAGIVTLTRPPGRYRLMAHGREGTGLGRHESGIRVPAFDSAPAISDLLVALPWNARPADRATMLTQVRRDLRFRAGATVRTFAELYGLSAMEGSLRYRARYSLLKTDNARQDAAKQDWPTAVRFEFERQLPTPGRRPVIETLDILPHWLTTGTYLLRLEIYDEVAARGANRATIMLRVDG